MEPSAVPATGAPRVQADSGRPERRQALYDAIAEGRTQNLIQIRTTTDNQGNRIPGKVDGGETKLIELYRVNGVQ